MNTSSRNSKSERFFIGIDYHKRYSVYCVLDSGGQIQERGRIEHRTPERFAALLKKWPGRIVFEASMNWHWLYELLEREVAAENILLANPFKTRIIAEAQVKTDKVDAEILARLLRAELIACVHIPARETRERKEVLRQRCFFVRQRTMLRNRIHRLLGAQHDLKLPQVSDLFGKKGLAFLQRLELPQPAGLLLKQQLEMLQAAQMRIKEDEVALREMIEPSAAYEQILSLPGMGPILTALVISEIDDIARFSSAQKLCGYAGLCPTTSSSGGKTYQGKLMRHCNKWLRWAFVEAAWVAVGCSAYFGDFYKKKRALGKKANTAILAVARRMARIAWQLLTEGRAYENNPPAHRIAGRKALAAPVAAPSVSQSDGVLSRRRRLPNLTATFPSRSDLRLVGPLE
jgi:transposase